MVTEEVDLNTEALSEQKKLRDYLFGERNYYKHVQGRSHDYWYKHVPKSKFKEVLNRAVTAHNRFDDTIPYLEDLSDVEAQIHDLNKQITTRK